MNTNLIKTVLAESNVIWFQIGAFLAFILFFVATVLWVYLPGSKAYYDKVAVDLLKGDSQG